MKMKGQDEITNGDNIIDSRDVIARIEYLEGLLQDFEDAKEENENASEGDYISEYEKDELKALKALAEEGESSPDWTYGETLIRDSYFEEYSQQLAEDIGAIDRNANWPLNHIDWTAAAEALRQDYTQVDFDGKTYWIRA